MALLLLAQQHKIRQTTVAMADGNLDALVAETINTMGKCIKRPPMTEKLLVKPPFRFLHDTITEARWQRTQNRCAQSTLSKMNAITTRRKLYLILHRSSRPRASWRASSRRRNWFATLLPVESAPRSHIDTSNLGDSFPCLTVTWAELGEHFGEAGQDGLFAEGYRRHLSVAPRCTRSSAAQRLRREWP